MTGTGRSRPFSASRSIRSSEQAVGDDSPAPRACERSRRPTRSGGLPPTRASDVVVCLDSCSASSGERPEGVAVTHVYFDAGRWAAVVYLSGPESAATGTEFLRHRDSRARRTSGARHTRAWLLLDGRVPPCGGCAASNDSTQWDSWGAVEHVTNRLVVSPAHAFHASGRSSDARAPDRLTQVFHFRWPLTLARRRWGWGPALGRRADRRLFEAPGTREARHPRMSDT